mgnify:FL=1|jgi:hypothetical protein
MTWIRNLLVFLYDFVVGDDWRMSLAVVLGLAATAVAVRAGFNPWWLLPVFVAVGLFISLRRVVRRTGEST